jgi:hypothetical protein
MRASYFGYVALIVTCQAALLAGMFYFSRSPDWVIHSLVTLAVVVPFLGYFVAFYRSPRFAHTRHLHRIVILTIIFSVATAIGFWVSMVVLFVLFMVFGGH